MYDIFNHTAYTNPYSAFPSLSKLGSSSAAPNMVRHLPPQAPQQQQQLRQQQPVITRETLVNPYQYLQVPENRFDPFPSLSMAKSALPEFCSSPAYVNSKFRKTRLW